jgi:fibronectin-binding autotransporter adhesin
MTMNILSVSRSRRALHWHASVSRLRACGLVAGALFGLAAIAPSVLAQDNYTYTGTTGTTTAPAPTTGTTFTAAFTDNSTSATYTTPLATDNMLTFGGSASYSATDDIASITLNTGLAFTNTAGTVTINTSNSSTINGGTGSTLAFALSTGSVTFNPAISEGVDTLAFSGAVGTGSYNVINGIISGSGGLTDSTTGGTGTPTSGGGGGLFLYGANTYTGGTTINSGATLVLDNPSALGATGAGNAVTVVSGGELDLNTGANGTVGQNITLNGTGVGSSGAIRGLGTVTLSGAITLGSNSTILNTNGTYAVTLSGGSVSLGTFTLTDTQVGSSSNSDVISGTGGLTLGGTGTITLTGANTYSGTTTISAGTLQISNGGTTATIGTGSIVDNAALVFDRSNAYSVSDYISGTGTVTALGTTGTLTLTGVLSGSVAVTVGSSTAGSGSLIFAGLANTYTGTTTIYPGYTLQVSTNGSSATLGTGNVTDNGALIFQRAANNYTIANVISGTGTVTQSGANVDILTAANTYTGTTTVSAGTLVVTGSTVAGSAVTVSGTGTTLGGTGTIAGTISVGNGSILQAGNAATVTPGTLTTGALTLATGSTFNAILASNSSFSTLSAGTNTTSLSNAAFNLTLASSASFTNNSVLELITSPVTGAFTNLAVTTGGYTFTANYLSNPGFFDVTITAVPEPAVWTYGLLAIGVMGVARGRKIKGRLCPARG